jgi:hypothetical protein
LHVSIVDPREHEGIDPVRVEAVFYNRVAVRQMVSWEG